MNSKISKHLLGSPFHRIFADLSEARSLASELVTHFSGNVEYTFDIPEVAGSKVIAIRSDLGNYSIIGKTETADFAEASLNTQLLFLVEDAEIVSEELHQLGYEMVWPLTKVTHGVVTRFKLPGDLIIQISEIDRTGLSRELSDF